MTKVFCAVCGCIYDPEEGDASHQVPPGTSFQDLPKDWACPGCAAGKAAFLPVEE